MTDPEISSGRAKSPPRRRSWPVFVVCALVGGFFGAAGFTFRSAEGLSYLSDDPHACINCHVMQEHFDNWRHASHGRVAVCNDCHVPHDSIVRKFYIKAENGYRHSKGFTFQDFHEPIQITSLSRDVVIENCMRCHWSIASDVTSHVVANYPASAASSLASDCLHCHSRVGHGPTR